MKTKVKILLVISFLALTCSTLFAQDNTWVAPKSANDMKNPFAGDAVAATKGKVMFNQMCSICHGIKGNGKGAAGVSLNPKPANFLSIRVKDESDGAIFWKLTNGNPPMASYKDMLTENQRWQLVTYIRQLEKQ